MSAVCLVHHNKGQNPTRDTAAGVFGSRLALPWIMERRAVSKDTKYGGIS